LEILRWASTTDAIVSSIFDDAAGHATYLSHDIQNELVDIMSNQIREEISCLVIRMSRFSVVILSNVHMTSS
jgi:hypothetical protein